MFVFEIVVPEKESLKEYEGFVKLGAYTVNVAGLPATTDWLTEDKVMLAV